MTTTDPEGLALLRAILMHPAEDTPRLVYADWLQEHGDQPRAEFVRVQCRIAGLHDANGELKCQKCERWTSWHVYTPRCRGAVCKMRQREYYTSRRFCVWDWCRGIPAGSYPVYRRGFVAEVSCSLAAFMQHAKALFSAHPIERVTLTTNDRAVWFNADRDIFGWWCEDELSTLTDPNILTLPLMIHMDGDKRRCDKLIANRFNCEEMRGCILFREDSHARDALSQACVAYGRSLAELPALEVA